MLRRILIIILFLLIAAAGAVVWWYFNQPEPPTMARVERGDIAAKVVDVLRDGRIQRVEVLVGLSDGVQTEIRQGLSEGEMVVVP